MDQIAFPLSSSDAYDLNEYIESSSNSSAYRALTNWPANWGINPYPKSLIIEGPKSSGKTFLATKWAKKSGALFIEKTQELKAEELNKYQAFIIDGFDDSWHEERLFHQFNIINENSKFLLITAVKIPAMKLPDLASRIKSINKISIGMLDDELMQMLIFKLFSNCSIVISQEVIQYLLKNLPRDFPEIIKSVKIINSFALRYKRKITIPLVKQALILSS